MAPLIGISSISVRTNVFPNTVWANELHAAAPAHAFALPHQSWAVQLLNKIAQKKVRRAE